MKKSMSKFEIIGGKKVQAVCCKKITYLNVCKRLCCFGKDIPVGSTCIIDCLDPPVYYVEKGDPR